MTLDDLVPSLIEPFIIRQEDLKNNGDFKA